MVYGHKTLKIAAFLFVFALFLILKEVRPKPTKKSDAAR